MSRLSRLLQPGDVHNTDEMRSQIKSRSPTPSTRGRDKLAIGTGIGSETFRYDVLETNNIFIEDSFMSETRWANLAFPLGLSMQPQRNFSTIASQLSQKMMRRKVWSEAQMIEAMRSFIASLITDCPKLSQQNKCPYRHDAVPTLEALRNTIHRLPVPKPAISIGYHREVFSEAQDELQNGIIAGLHGEPIDLSHISQPVAGHFWPFFVVEISEKSMSAAKQAGSIAGSTCNNAVSLLTNAASAAGDHGSGTVFQFDANHARSFSLSIYDRLASFDTHAITPSGQHLTTTITTYQLDVLEDVTCLADRVHSIFTWSQHSRLQEIISVLNQLNYKVHGKSLGLFVHDDDEFDPSCLKSMGDQPARRPERLKIALTAGLPRWLSS